MASVLFFFTKEFPYGNHEQYIVDELPYLAETFDEVVIVPAELFTPKDNHRTIPPNVSILNINEECKNTVAPAHMLEKLKILSSEFLHEKDKWRFIKEFKRYNAILEYQFKVAAFMNAHLQKYSNSELFFYTYWLHNSSVMLGLLKEKGIIRHYISRAHAIDIFHNDWPGAYLPGMRVLPYQYFKTRTASAVYPISENGAGYFRKKYPHLSEKFSVHYLGVEDKGTGLFSPHATFNMVSCSSVTPRKRVTDIAKAFSKLEFPATWHHFGDGEDMREVSAITQNLPSHLKAVLPGFTANHEVLSFYKNNSVNLFINVSTAEGIPVSIMEAASFGIPCLATNVNGNAEALPPASPLVIPSDFQTTEITNLISIFAKDVQWQEKLRNATRSHFLKHFESSRNYTAFSREILKWKN